VVVKYPVGWAALEWVNYFSSNEKYDELNRRKLFSVYVGTWGDILPVLTVQAHDYTTQHHLPRFLG
jgi:hypothetical protein